MIQYSNSTVILLFCIFTRRILTRRNSHEKKDRKSYDELNLNNWEWVVYMMLNAVVIIQIQSLKPLLYSMLQNPDFRRYAMVVGWYGMQIVLIWPTLPNMTWQINPVFPFSTTTPPPSLPDTFIPSNLHFAITPLFPLILFMTGPSFASFTHSTTSLLPPKTTLRTAGRR